MGKQQGNTDQPIRYQGQYEDEESGLYYNRHRYYDPQLGRYVNQDPIGFLGGMNTYTCADNNSIIWIDNMGLSPSSACSKSCIEKCETQYEKD